MTMNRTTMRYPKLEQTITAAEYILEFEDDRLGEESIGAIEANLSKMRGLDKQIKMIPYRSSSAARDEANSKEYDALEARADALIRETTELLWPKAVEAAV